MTKPAGYDDLVSALHDASAQHDLITAERVLLEQTLRGAVAAMLEALSLSNPLVFARATRYAEEREAESKLFATGDRSEVRRQATLCALELLLP